MCPDCRNTLIAFDDEGDCFACPTCRDDSEIVYVAYIPMAYAESPVVDAWNLSDWTAEGCRLKCPTMHVHGVFDSEDEAYFSAMDTYSDARLAAVCGVDDLDDL